MTAPARELTGRNELVSRLRRNVKMRTGLALLFLFCLLAVSHPVLRATVWGDEPAVYHPETGYDIGTHPSAPSARHLLGTDALGRDVLSLLTFALAPTLMVVLTAAAVIGLLSTTSGAVAAFFRGKTDGLLSRIADALVLLPPPIALLVVALDRPDFGPVDMGLLYGFLFGLGPAAVVVRSRALAVMGKPFVEAARASGGGAGWIIRTHLVPHLLPYAAVQMMAGVTGAVITAGFLELLGAARTRIGLGSLVYLGLTYQGVVSSRVAWSQLLAGALSISLLASAFYLLSVGLREAIDPRPADM